MQKRSQLLLRRLIYFFALFDIIAAPLEYPLSLENFLDLNCFVGDNWFVILIVHLGRDQLRTVLYFWNGSVAIP